MKSCARTLATAGVLLLTALLVAGCATPQVASLLARAPGDLPARAELEAVPFYPQEDYQCGPAALATVLTYNGIAVTPEALVERVYLPAREGSLQAEMLGATRRYEEVAYRLAPQLEDLLREVAGGNPVVVLQNLAFPFMPRWHYAVVVGFDRTTKEIFLRSGTTRRLTMTFTNFERTWARSGYWAMLALPPERLPMTAIESDYVAAAAALERASPAAAYRAYGAALGRWPRNLAARIGLGNSAYALRDLAAAEAAYRSAVNDHPQSADAWNNLAQVLFELDRKDDALSAAQRAVSLGGPRVARYQATLKTITESR